MNVTDQSNNSTDSLPLQLPEILPLDDHTNTQSHNTQNELKSDLDEIQLKINPQYKKLSYDPKLAHHDAIKTSIEKNGQYHKIIINNNGEILDGHKRYRICTELNITPQVEVRSFESQEQEEVFVIESNLARTHYTTYERVELAEKFRPDLEKQAEQRQKSGKATFPQYCVKVDSHYYETDSILARLSRTSATTYRKYLAIINSDNLQLKDDIKNEKISISQACKKLQKSLQKIVPNEIPKIKHNVILANPKWVNKNGSHTRCIDYPRIIHSCSNENAVLVLHVSNEHIANAIDLIHNSDFEYHRLYSINTKSSKFIIVAKRGEIILPDLEFGSNKAHKIIEDAFPDQKYVELWTDKKYSDKWTAWNETEIISILENTPEWKRSRTITLTEYFEDFGSQDFDR